MCAHSNSDWKLASIKYSLFIQSMRSTTGLLRKWIFVCNCTIWCGKCRWRIIHCSGEVSWARSFLHSAELPVLQGTKWFDCCIYFHIWNMGMLVLLHSPGMSVRWSTEFLKESYYPGGYRGVEIQHEWHILLFVRIIHLGIIPVCDQRKK